MRTKPWAMFFLGVATGVITTASAGYVLLTSLLSAVPVAIPWHPSMDTVSTTVTNDFDIWIDPAWALGWLAGAVVAVVAVVLAAAFIRRRRSNGGRG